MDDSLGAAHVPAERLNDDLVTQTHTEYRNVSAGLPDEFGAATSILGSAGTR